MYYESSDFLETADSDTLKQIARTRELTREYYFSDYGDIEKRTSILRELLGGIGENVVIDTPFHCDYGKNIFLGNDVIINMNCTFVDNKTIRIGDRVLIASNVQMYTSSHPVLPQERLVPDWRERKTTFFRTYVFKFGIVTNGLGIIRHISFYNKNFMASHPDIVVEKKSDSPDEDKCVHDSKLLIPTLKDFFSKHPLINPKTFLGDAAFDTAQLYKSLLTGDTFGNDKHFSKAYIPLNARSGLENLDYSINEDGIPCCPHDPSLQMKYEGTSKLRSGVTRYKFVCPRMKWIYDKSTQKSHRHCFCDNPCTSSKCGRMVYIYPEKNLRAYPGAIRGTEEWDDTYKIRTVVERDINHIKDNLCLAGRRTQNERTLHADLILAGITQLITVVLADKINHHEYIRSLKPLIA